MRVFAACLHKEWCELRGWAVALAVCVPVLLLAYCIGFPEHWERYEQITLMCGGLSMLLGGLSLGGRLVSMEVTGSGMGFIDRLPRGLTLPFLAKASVLVLAIAICTLYGNLVAGAISTLGFDKAYDWAGAFTFRQWAAPLAFVGPAFGLMVLSAWMPRSGMTLPGLMLLYIVVIGPAWLCFDLLPGFRPTPKEFLMAWVLLSVGTIAAAGASFIRGYRRSGGPGRALLNGGLVMLLFTLPIWGWTGYRTWRWMNCDPTSPDVRIIDGFVGADRRTAFLTVINWDPHERSQTGTTHTVRVDLKTGEWERGGGAGTQYRTVGNLDHSDDASSRTGFPKLLVMTRKGEATRDVIDTVSGSVVHRFAKGSSLATISRNVREVKRDSAPWRLPDGRRVWFYAGNFEAETDDGGTEIILSTDALAVRNWSFSGVVYLPGVVNRDHKVHPCDLARRRVLDHEAWDDTRVFAILGGGALLAKRHSRSLSRDWLIEDPDSRSRSRAPGLEGRDVVLGQHDETRVWVLSFQGKNETRALHLVDVARGTRIPVRCRGVNSGDMLTVFSPTVTSSPARTPDGRRIYRLRNGDETCLARFDEKSASLTRSAFLPHDEGDSGYSMLIACPDDDTAIVILNSRKIVRLRFGSDEIETLFPRE